MTDTLDFPRAHLDRILTLERFPQRLNRERFPPRENSDSESLLGMEAGMDGQSIVAGFA